MNTSTLIRKCLKDITEFTRTAGGITLRSYQTAPAVAIVESVKQALGMTFVVMLPRQSGKNELQAQLQTYLMAMLSGKGGQGVIISPTWKPQTQNAMDRLEQRLRRNKLTAKLGWKSHSGYIYQVGECKMIFLSGQPRSNIVGQTADILIMVDEAQDVLQAKYDKEIAPMAASTNATRVFFGTAWTNRTLLARELRAARQAELADGRRRVFVVDGEAVAAELPAYRRHLDQEIQRMGRNHPLIMTQYYCEEIDAISNFFTADRLALMAGTHSLIETPQPGELYAITIDVAGEDEGVTNESELANQKRNNTAITIYQLRFSEETETEESRIQYQVVNRHVWIGVKHSRLFARIKALVDHWGAGYVVIDATGIGAGLASFLQAKYGDRVIPVIFNQKVKSELGWNWIAAIESGRWKDHQAPADDGSRLRAGRQAARPAGRTAPLVGHAAQDLFREELENCRSEILEGPGHVMRWGVPDGTRNGAGDLVNDDTIISAAMVTMLDELQLARGDSTVNAGEDPLGGFSDVY